MCNCLQRLLVRSVSDRSVGTVQDTRIRLPSRYLGWRCNGWLDATSLYVMLATIPSLLFRLSLARSSLFFPPHLLVSSDRILLPPSLTDFVPFLLSRG